MEGGEGDCAGAGARHPTEQEKRGEADSPTSTLRKRMWELFEALLLNCSCS